MCVSPSSEAIVAFFSLLVFQLLLCFLIQVQMYSTCPEKSRHLDDSLKDCYSCLRLSCIVVEVVAFVVLVVRPPLFLSIQPSFIQCFRELPSLIGSTIASYICGGLTCASHQTVRRSLLSSRYLYFRCLVVFSIRRWATTAERMCHLRP